MEASELRCGVSESAQQLAAVEEQLSAQSAELARAAEEAALLARFRAPEPAVPIAAE
jgi:hypothetical protein